MRQAARITGAALFAAVLMTGCSSSDDDGKGEGTASKAPAADVPASGDAGKGVGASDLEGGWATDATHTDQGLLILSVQGGTATLLGKTSCTGKVEDSRPVKLTLACKDGSSDRSDGSVVRGDAESLTISWGSGKESTFKRTVTPDGKPKLPSGLPTDLPTDLDLPTGLPTDLDLPTDLQVPAYPPVDRPAG
ncbi:hypothetical protein [Streptomyces sp. NPDC018031]|uniref:hypothetical protein n=1 Tax=Streptomyces sp. NPDC018031 TaxID=3365033 RepID=UPI00379AC522